MSNLSVSTGGNGSGSDDVTAVRAQVLSGYTAVTHDSDDEPAMGTMPDNGSPSVSLKAGETHNILPGYYNGGSVAAVSLASQTGGITADDSKVLNGYTYWKDGVKRTGSLTVQSIVSFKVAQYSNLNVIGSWAKPSKGPWSGVRILCKQGGYPASASDGTLFYEGDGTSATKSLAAGTWYFGAWNYLTTSAGRIYGEYIQATVNNQQIKGQKVFTSSGNFTVPSYVKNIDIFCVGGGGTGGTSKFDSGDYSSRGDGGGGGGYTFTQKGYSVTPGQKFAITVGAASGTSSFSSIISASGGENAPAYTINDKIRRKGGNGGSGGGGYSNYATDKGGQGGSDGSDGNVNNISEVIKSGIGQHTTTRAFGESNGALYSGGGGTGSIATSLKKDRGGRGGGGGGGNGGTCPSWSEVSSDYYVYNQGTNAIKGAVNTGGGGGGGAFAYSSAKGETSVAGASGGSGIVIIRWGY